MERISAIVQLCRHHEQIEEKIVAIVNHPRYTGWFTPDRNVMNECFGRALSDNEHRAVYDRVCAHPNARAASD